MTDLIIDAPIVGSACNKTSLDVLNFLKSRKHANHRNWVYVGQKNEIVKLLYGETKNRDNSQLTQLEKEKLKFFEKTFLWLAALSEDGDTVHDTDPTAAALSKAAERLGNDTKVLTEDGSWLARGIPFIDLQTAVEELCVESNISFIDLRSQQDQIRPRLERSIHQVLHHGKYVNGPEISELELALAEFVGVKHCVSVSSGTDALLIALLSLGIGRGDEVVTTTFSFIATCEVILLTGATPVFVDVDHRTGNLNPEQLEERLTSRTRAILPVSLYGQTADMSRINEIASAYRLPVIEDAAQSFGALHYGKRSCGLSTIGCTSFFPAKSLGAYGDAGACFTEDPDIAQIMRELLNHGQQQRYQHVRIGVNGRMDSLQAAILLSKLELFQWELESRQGISNLYSDLMRTMEGEDKLTLPFIEKGNYSAWAQYTIRVTDRDLLQKTLASVDIPTAIHYPRALPDQPALKQFRAEFPNSEMLAQTVLSLPMHPYLTVKNQTNIVDAIRSAIS